MEEGGGDAGVMKEGGGNGRRRDGGRRGKRIRAHRDHVEEFNLLGEALVVANRRRLRRLPWVLEVEDDEDPAQQCLPA